MRFTTTLLQAGKTATGFRVPTEVMEALASGKKPAVSVTINGFRYRSTVATVDGHPMVGVSDAVRKASGVAGGDQIDVELAVDTAPREVTVPPDLAAALDRDPAARRTFDALSFSNKQFWTMSVEGAKTDETRLRRIDKAIATLHEGRPR